MRKVTIASSAQSNSRLRTTRLNAALGVLTSANSKLTRGELSSPLFSAKATAQSPRSVRTATGLSMAVYPIIFPQEASNERNSRGRRCQDPVLVHGRPARKVGDRGDTGHDHPAGPGGRVLDGTRWRAPLELDGPGHGVGALAREWRTVAVPVIV